MDQVVHCKTILSTETIAYGDICGARKLYEVCYLYSLLNEFTTVPMARVKGCVIAGPRELASLTICGMLSFSHDYFFVWIYILSDQR
jgi:hypothetical protein